MISPNFPRKTLLFLGSFPVRSWFPSHHLAGLPPSHHMNASGKKPRLEHLGTWNPAPASTHFCTEKFFPDDWCLLVDVGWLVGWLGGWVVGWLVDWLIDWFVGWLIDWFDWLCLPCDVFNLSSAIHVNVQWYANPPGWLLMSPVQMIVSQIIIQLTAVCIPIVKNPLLVSHIPLLGGVSFQQKHFWGWATFSQKINLQQKFNTS